MKQIYQETNWVKISGAGNSFLMTYFKELPIVLKNKLPLLSQRICSKNQMDGIVVLLPAHEKGFDLQWLFYNADGSTAEMCVNAACCVVAYAVKKKIVSKNPFLLETLHHRITGELKHNKAYVSFRQNFKIQGPFFYQFNNESISYMFINTSVPHAIIKRSQVPYREEEVHLIKSIGKDLRYKTDHDKRGMNVSFYCETHQQNTVSACTFERGVENITPACGTGALAVAKIHQQVYPHLQHIYVTMPGGQLRVDLSEEKLISLSSPVQWIGEINFQIP